MGRTMRGILVLVTAAGVAGCEAEINGAGVGPAGIHGLWIGSEEITDAADIASQSPDGRGFTFPVALELRPDGYFLLRSPSFSMGGQGDPDRKTCSGVYSLSSRSISFFPNAECRALPLHRFELTTVLDRRLVLQAFEPEWNMQVWIRAERD